MSAQPIILWIGDGAPAAGPASVSLLHQNWSGDSFPDADLIVLARDAAGLPERDLPTLKDASVPVAVVADGLTEKQLRRVLNHYPVFKIFQGDVSAGLPIALAEAVERRKIRSERASVLANFSRRNRELEGLTERLEAAVVERTGVLESSTREEKDKLARERQLIRFLSEISLMTATEDLLRVMRRELRRFHRVQSFVLAVSESGSQTRFFCSQGDRVLHADGPENLSEIASDHLRQVLANRFGRPFNKLMILPLEMRPPNQGVFGVEYSLLNDDEIEEIHEILQERARATGMVVERLSFEDRLRRSTVRWERTFDGFRDPIAVIDTEMNLLRGNRSFALKGSRRKCFEIFAGREEPCEGCPLPEKIADPSDVEGTVKVGRRTFRMRSWPVPDERGSGRVTGRVTSYDDITEARELSLRMLQNEKMSAIGELAGHIAHELNNPLTGIRSLAQVLKAEWPDPPLGEDLAQIENAARRCQAIIHHLLEFTRSEESDLVPITVDEVVEMTLPLLKTSLRVHRQEIQLGASNAKIIADVHLLQQVIFNLVNNACQAHKKPGRVGVTTRTCAENGKRFVELRVYDDGPGIAPEIRHRLFEPFVTTKKEGEGTGLGLSTSKAIVERFGGTIECRSEAGEGTEFTLKFPLKEEP